VSFDFVPKPRPCKKEEGMVLLMVLLLVVMFSGLGLLALRHTQAELRSSGAYMDSTQAAEAAEAAVMMVATDMRRNWRYPNASNKCLNYYTKFQQAVENNTQEDIQIGFSDVFNTSDDCSHIGGLPVSALNSSAPLALTGGSSGPSAHSLARVSLRQSAPRQAPPPPGFSSDDEARTYGWYYFTVTSRAQYGYGSAATASETDTDTQESEEVVTVRGKAVVRSLMKIGPLDAVGAD
jgi:Tfp pilus assembly protein PilX